MLINIIIICAGLIGLFAVAKVIYGKLTQVANLDVDHLPQEIESKKKKEIIARRTREQGLKITKALSAKFSPLNKLWREGQLKFRVYVGKIERLWHHEQIGHVKSKTNDADAQVKSEEISEAVRLAEQCVKAGKYEQAEELYISIIKKNPKSVLAYRGLGDAYFTKGAMEEALETYIFLLKLSPHDDAAMIKVAEISEAKGDLEKAIEYTQHAAVINDSLSPRFYHLAELLLKVKQPDVAKEAMLSAVELEPKNPKYLDLLIEIGILCGDKILAENGYNELRLVNPENQKLADFQTRIKAL